MRIQLLFLTLFILSSAPLIGQKLPATPKNFPAFFVGVEGSTASALKGVAYERVLYTEGSLALGASGSYIFKYNLKNMSWISGSSEYRSVGLLLGKATFYTSSAKKQAGFFLHMGLGLGLTHRQKYNGTIDEWHPAGDIGLGWYMPFNATTGIQISPSLLYASSGGIIRLKAAFAF